MSSRFVSANHADTRSPFLDIRVVDSKTIIYFAAQSPAEALAWRDAIRSCTS